MKIITSTVLSSNQFYDAKTLIELCRMADNTKGVSFLENGVNAIEDFPCFYMMYQDSTLISFLSVFVPNQEECEIYANTLPRYRRQGYFRQLFEQAKEQIKNYGIQKVYFVNEPSCYAGSEALGKLGAKLDSSEYLMSYNMRIDPKPRGILRLEYIEDNGKNILNTYRGDIHVGRVQYLVEHDVATIYGVEIEPKFRGRRYGVETLLLAVEYLKGEGCCKIILHVSGANKIAYQLYSHHGFVHVEQLDYWIKLIL